MCAHLRGLENAESPTAHCRRAHLPDRLLVQPVPGAVLPAQELVRAEPERYLAAGALHRVAAVNHVPVRERRA